MMGIVNLSLDTQVIIWGWYNVCRGRVTPGQVWALRTGGSMLAILNVMSYVLLLLLVGSIVLFVVSYSTLLKALVRRRFDHLGLKG